MLGQPAQVSSVEPQRDSAKRSFVLRISWHYLFAHAGILSSVAWRPEDRLRWVTDGYSEGHSRLP